MTDMEPEELCGRPWDCVECYIDASCHLPKGHDGDHELTVRWPQWVPRPRDPNREPSGIEKAPQSAYTPLLNHALAATSVFARPTAARPGQLVDVDGELYVANVEGKWEPAGRARIVNRDKEG